MTTTMVYFVPSPSSSSSLPPTSSPSSSPSSSSNKVAGLNLLAEAAMIPFPTSISTSTSSSTPPHFDYAHLSPKYHDHDTDHHPHPHPHLHNRYRPQQHPSTPPASSPLRQSPSRSPSPSSSSSSSSSYSSSSSSSFSPPLSSKTHMDLPDPAAATTTADSSLSSPLTLRQHISSMVSPIQAQAQAQSSLASVPLPRNVFYFVDPAHVESQPLGVQSTQLQEFLLAVVKSEWGPRYQICRFPLFDDIISCVLWEGRYHVTGTDIVKYVSWRFRLEGLGIGEQKKFEEGIFSDLRNLKPGTDSVLEEPRSKFLEFLFKAGCVRTHKKQKVFFWNSVPFERLFQEAVRREKRRDINPVLNSLLSLKSTRDSEDEASQPRPTKKSRIMAPAPTTTAFATSVSSPPPPMVKLLPNTSTSPSSSASVLPSFRDLNQSFGSNSAFLPPLGLALSGLLNLKEAAVPHPYPKGN